jgi:hypothetical protein
MLLTFAQAAQLQATEIMRKFFPDKKLRGSSGEFFLPPPILQPGKPLHGGGSRNEILCICAFDGCLQL